jgi:phage tail sheath gpL-like
MPANGSIVLANGAQENNVYFITGTTFIFGATCTVYGTIIAGTAITFAATSVLHGHALVRGGTGGTSITFPSAGTVTVVSAVPTSNPIVIGATSAITAQNIANAINADAHLSQVVVASVSGSTVTITSLIGGEIGNCITMSVSADAEISGSHLTGGTQDADVVMYNGIREAGNAGVLI